ncbi:hypothetical protein BC628DRAFT_1131023 [Trametes gibbosa]|nr:hypothetical protein BC628DRAFT_1131023 [Trametes gibbosa]
MNSTSPSRRFHRQPAHARLHARTRTSPTSTARAPALTPQRLDNLRVRPSRLSCPARRADVESYSAVALSTEIVLAQECLQITGTGEISLLTRNFKVMGLQDCCVHGKRWRPTSSEDHTYLSSNRVFAKLGPHCRAKGYEMGQHSATGSRMAHS